MMNQNDQDRLERSLKGKTSKTPDAAKLARSTGRKHKTKTLKGFKAPEGKGYSKGKS